MTACETCGRPWVPLIRVAGPPTVGPILAPACTCAVLLALGEACCEPAPKPFPSGMRMAHTPGCPAFPGQRVGEAHPLEHRVGG